MGEIWLTGLLSSYRGLAIPISLLIEILIAVLGVLPSFFITAANITVFGIWWGGALSIAGESLGAVVAFMLYRRGFDKLTGGHGQFSTSLKSRIERFSDATEGRSFLLVLAFRLLPYMPSGAVTLGAAGSRMKLYAFVLSSTLGKLPALGVEVATVSLALKLPLKGFLAVAAAVILGWVLFEVLKLRRAHAE
ncbi:MAG: TVP38/TMEM64 family protein [Spirochaetaceae bacterium]|nr:TVP38/TMEM64 family protein [Spirochaetaceae bacterium]